MLVSEVISLTKWIEEEISKPALTTKYAQLIHKLQANVSGQRQPFDQERKNLNQAIGSISLKVLSEAQINILEKMDAHKAIGRIGLTEINDIFVENALDIATAKTRVDELKSSIDKVNQWAKISREALFEYFDEEIIDESNSLDIIIRVRFTDEAGINNVVDFKKWAAIWYDILRGFALANGRNPEEFRFIGGTTGSLIAMFASDPVNVAAVVVAMERGLAFANNVIDFKLKIAELKKSPFKSDSGIKALEQSLLEKKDEAPDVIVSEILGEQVEGDGEKRNALKKSIVKLLDFLEKGGEVDFVIPDIDENDATEADLEDAFKQLESIRTGVKRIRETKRTIALIEHHEDED